MIRINKDELMTSELLSNLIARHKKEVASRLIQLDKAYKNQYEIYDYAKKYDGKPDNRISVNFAKYIVDVMNGYFTGIPIQTSSEDNKVQETIDIINSYNKIDDHNSEISRLSSIFGVAYEMYYIDENSQIGIARISPLECFMVYDDSILAKPLYFIRYYKDSRGVEVGSYSDRDIVRHFKKDGEYKFIDEGEAHYFGDVPASELKENDDNIGIFESVLPIINAYNKAISQKANDVDYFADAYMKILGASLDDETIRNIRSNRIINFSGDPDVVPQVEFLQKPNADTTQENLIDRLERLIYQISMVSNISSEDFGNASGVSLKYKLQAMSSLAKTKERKFIALLNNRYKVLFSNPLINLHNNEWAKIKYKFTQNIPANILEESQIVGNLEGVISKETQLSTLSIVDSPLNELARINKEQEQQLSTLGFTHHE